MVRIKIVTKTNESKRSECYKNKGEFCYMHDPDVKSKGKTTIEPPKIKKEDKMIKRITPEEIIRRNEKTVEEFLNDDRTDTRAIALISDKLDELEKNLDRYKELFSQPGFAHDLIQDVLSDMN